MAVDGKIVLLVSDELAAEIQYAPKQVQDKLFSLPTECFERLATNDEAVKLHEAYLKAGILGKASENDALHVANATVAKADIIVSWNFKHIVHYDKIIGFNSVNMRQGYGTIAIYSPKEVV
jgi:predicted nucleic acid-binding protein